MDIHITPSNRLRYFQQHLQELCDAYGYEMPKSIDDKTGMTYFFDSGLGISLEDVAVDVKHSEVETVKLIGTPTKP